LASWLCQPISPMAGQFGQRNPWDAPTTSVLCAIFACLVALVSPEFVATLFSR
jgi:hypothetical protein